MVDMTSVEGYLVSLFVYCYLNGPGNGRLPVGLGLNPRERTWRTESLEAGDLQILR